MTLSIGDADVRASATMPEIISAVEQALLEEHDGFIIMPPRANLMREGNFLRVMPVYMARSGLYGYKSFHGSMAKGVRYIIVLCRESDGEILAIVDAAHLTGVRTGATSGVATKYMAPDGPATVGLIGSGLEAATNLEAVAAVRPVTKVFVYSRKEENRNRFARETSARMGIEVVPVSSPEAAVKEGPIVIAATNTGHNGPVALEGRWLQKGQHVVSIGATSPFLHEADPETFERSDIVVFDTPAEQVFEECGDLMYIEGPLRGHLHKTVRTLPDVVAAGSIGRKASDITLFKSVGSAAQDIASAKAVYDRVVAKKSGRDIGELAIAKIF